MTTLSVDDEHAVAEATAALDAGDLVVIPGDLCYLVAADALDDHAIEHLFLATQRAADRPLSVVVAGYEDIHHVGFAGVAVRELTDAHWPGAVTLLVRARPWLPDALTAGAAEVGITAPAQPFARALAKLFGPIAIASARRAGEGAPLTLDAARASLGAQARLHVDGGALPGGEAKVIRAGSVAPER